MQVDVARQNRVDPVSLRRSSIDASDGRRHRIHRGVTELMPARALVGVQPQHVCASVGLYVAEGSEP